MWVCVCVHYKTNQIVTSTTTTADEMRGKKNWNFLRFNFILEFVTYSMLIRWRMPYHYSLCATAKHFLRKQKVFAPPQKLWENAPKRNFETTKYSRQNAEKRVWIRQFNVLRRFICCFIKHQHIPQQMNFFRLRSSIQLICKIQFFYFFKNIFSVLVRLLDARVQETKKKTFSSNYLLSLKR